MPGRRSLRPTMALWAAAVLATVVLAPAFPAVARAAAPGARLWTSKAWSPVPGGVVSTLRMVRAEGGQIYCAAIVAPRGARHAAGTPMLQRAVGGQLWLARFNASGKRLWQRRVTHPGSARFLGGDMIVDRAGRVTIASTAMSSRRGLDWFVAQTDPKGLTRWRAVLRGPGAADDRALGVAADSDGSTVVTGYVDTGAGTRCYTMKYSPTGATVWGPTPIQSITPAAASEGADVSLDAGGRAYVTAEVQTAVPGPGDIVTACYTREGAQDWYRLYDGPASGDDNPAALCVSEAGVAVVGSAQVAGGGRQAVMLRYGLDGSTSWGQVGDGGYTSKSGLGCVAMDADGYAFAGGTASLASSPSGDNWATMAYGPAGGPPGTDVRIGDDPSRYDACGAVGVVSRPERRYYGAGYLTDTPDRRYGFITATVAGLDRWTYAWTGAGSRQFTAMATSTNGVFVAGVAPEGVRLMKFVP